MAIIRFPQERCRWPEPGDRRFAPAVLLILPSIRIEREEPIASAETDRRVRAFIDELRNLD